MTETAPRKADNPFCGLGVGRIVHVCYKLPTPGNPVVERPAIVTSVKDKDAGVVSVHVFKDPSDPPGEVFAVDSGRMARVLGTEVRYCPKDPPRPWTWHWPERVD